MLLRADETRQATIIPQTQVVLTLELQYVREVPCGPTVPYVIRMMSSLVMIQIVWVLLAVLVEAKLEYEIELKAMWRRALSTRREVLLLPGVEDSKEFMFN
jgi:hypothetical protein